MNNMLYLFSTGLVLLIFTSYYFFFLKESKNFLFNRIYLAGAGLLSFIINIPGFFTVNDSELLSYSLGVINVSSLNTGTQIASVTVSFTDVLWIVYFTGVLVLILTNGMAYLKIRTIIRKGNRDIMHGSTVVINESIIDSFSFLNTIVVPSSNVSAFVIRHEQAHVKGIHAADLFFAELVCTILWFMPFIRYFKKAVVLNHEFIADSASGTKDLRNAYCEQLLAHTIKVPGFSLSHTFSNHSITKTRIQMLYKNPMSKMRSITVGLLIIPIIAVTLLISSCKDEMNNMSEVSNQKITAGQSEVLPEFPGGNEALMAFLGSNITYPESAKNNKTEGKVFVQFVVDPDGKITGVSVVKGVSEELDKEAERVISSMPNWKPGTKNGKPVSMQMTIPIMFALQ